jgi:hypothetical protein
VCAQKGAWVEGQSSCTDDLLCDERKYATTATNVFADPAPTNNVCAKSIDIDPALLPFLDVRDTTFATFEEVDREIQSDCGSVSYPGNDGSVWYKFRAPQNGDLTIDTSGSNYGTVVSVHHETGECSGLGDVACEVCEKLYSISPEDAVLRQIDVNTGLTLDTIPLTAEPVAQALHGNVFGGHGLATSPVTGELFSLICFGGECEDDHERLLAKIEVHSGLVSVVGDPGTDPRLTNLAFDRNGALYGIDRNGNLYTLSTLDGTALLVCDAGDGGSQTISFNPADGHLYHADGFSNVDFDRIDDTSTPTCGSTAIPVDGTPLDTNAPRALTYWETGGVFIWAQKGEDDEESKLFHVTASGDPFEVGTALDHATRGLAFVKCGPGDPGIRLTVAVTGGETYRIVVSECGLSTCGGDKFLRLAVNFTRRGCGSLGQTCDDLSKCTENDQCREGAGGLLECRGTTKSCVDDNECTTDSCSAATGCVNAPNTNPCNDNKPCTTNDRCNGAGTCVGGPPPNCTDGNLCTTDSCDSTTGCVNTPNANPCNDGNACTLTDTCSNGDCIGSPEVTCDDNNACTTDPTTCDPVRGCVYAPRTGACDDGNACTTGDTCVNALCVGGLAKDCDDSNVCTTDTCNPLTEDGCVHTNNTDFCDDRVFCNGKDICANGICTHPGNPCTGNAFCSNVCNEAADNCFRANQTDCNDGLDCTLSDRCVNGQCVGDSPCPTGEKCIEELDGQCVACIGVSQVQQGGAIRCGINRPCGLPVRLATNGISNAFILAGQESVDQMSLDCPSDSCRPGLSVPTGLPGLAAVCSVNKNVATVNNPTDSCSFYLFQPDRRLEMSFKTGTVAEVPITCRQSGTSTLSLKNLEIADDSGDLVPLCTEEPTATFVCDDCLAGDCISNGRVQVNDAICVLWCGLQSTLRLQAEAQGWDCLCAADCNCDGVTNVVDALCSLHRLINNGRIPGVDRCQGAAASLALGGPERVYEPVKVWVGTAEIPEGGKRKRAFVSLARQGSDQAAAVQASVQAVGGDVLKVRLVKRLRDAGFTLASGQDGSLAEFAILPPAVQPLPATGGGRLVRVVVSADTDAVALGGVEVGSPTGDLVPTE